MSEKKTKQPVKPHALQLDGQRVRICGRWRKKGYTPDAEEIEAWKEICKDRGWDPKTGKPKPGKASK